jgi:hypothetical protein
LRALCIIAIVAARSAAAQPTCDPTALRTELADEAARMDRWRLGWTIGYGALTAGQLALAAANWNPIGPDDREFRDSRYVGAAESGIGALASLFAPHIDVPDPVADSCADVAALEAARSKAGKLERTLFWGSHAGNLVVNAAGSLILAERTNWSTAALAFAIGYPVGLLNTYTMPRASWHAMRVVPVPLAVDRGAALMLIGSF